MIVAWAVFLLVQAANRIWREPVAAEEAPAATAEEQLLTEIRDLLAHDRAA